MPQGPSLHGRCCGSPRPEHLPHLFQHPQPHTADWLQVLLNGRSRHGGGGGWSVGSFNSLVQLITYSTASPGRHLLSHFPEGKAEAQRGGQGMQVYLAQENAGLPTFGGWKSDPGSLGCWWVVYCVKAEGMAAVGRKRDSRLHTCWPL